MNWISITNHLPEEGKIVNTKIDDKDGCRNEQKLILKDNLWWSIDMKTYVYYTPTYWSY